MIILSIFVIFQLLVCVAKVGARSFEVFNKYFAPGYVQAQTLGIFFLMYQYTEKARSILPLY